ncbi:MULTISPECIES: AAA family ATPase [Romboutsia]|uniref:Possible nitric oxide reductase n=1 Tax=Romboutsia hominis TaxID=1507512 RepID=A0A2P2BUS9_9FIRM|nr:MULTISPECIES: MoxR family ATPase [Romboutsia]MCH1959098.1 MoxR family ATPase [Romboutsia hominis]MCH1968218.1 MoxR family ATPase [Romboutsia hominis]MDB8789463.1 MoxR family ATPase [Romboutsia sp. 1001216sp1]MDB8793927.1 MoxR family ATPase [Romboutsia sp. 1001216sp1]MDB8796614.1 MoxR family ATPase [Romboutsia sp. 1001216sp1]
MGIIVSLLNQGVDEKLINDAIKFKEFYKIDENLKHRISDSTKYFYGKDIWNMAISAILEGENILLSGPKATGKNLLADNLSELFGRPQWNTSFHINTDSTTLIGTDTFIDNEVKLRRGSVYECAINGGFGIFDEINMAKNDAIAVLHSALDYRRVIDVPGYERINLHDATRFIGTMNYEYAGTKELNEALVSRFMVIDIPAVEEEKLMLILKKEFEDADEEKLIQFGGIFLDLQLKSQNGEISSKSVDLRGLIGSLKAIRRGLKPSLAVNMGVTSKTFDVYEKEIVGDIIKTRIPDKWETKDIFPKINTY